MLSLEIAKLPTRIEGFDDILGGGIPIGDVVLLAGLPGTMKSALSYSILFNNAIAKGIPSLYISLEQSRTSLDRQMRSMGLNTTSAYEHVRVLDLGEVQKTVGKGGHEVWIDYLKWAVRDWRAVGGAEVVVLDSLDALCVLARFEDRRRALFDLFQWLRDLGTTAILLAEAPRDGMFAGLERHDPHEEEFLADGIIYLKMHPVNDLEIQRRIRVVKMRACHHKTGHYALVFEDGRFSVTGAIGD